MIWEFVPHNTGQHMFQCRASWVQALLLEPSCREHSFRIVERPYFPDTLSFVYHCGERCRKGRILKFWLSLRFVVISTLLRYSGGCVYGMTNWRPVPETQPRVPNERLSHCSSVAYCVCLHTPLLRPRHGFTIDPLD